MSYFEVRNKYLAEALAFFNFKYYKFGFGKDTIYSFKDTKEIKEIMNCLIQLKKNQIK